MSMQFLGNGMVRAMHQTEWEIVDRVYQCRVRWPDGSKCQTVDFGIFGPPGTGTRCGRIFETSEIPPGVYQSTGLWHVPLIPLDVARLLFPNVRPLLRFPGWRDVGAGARVWDDGRNPDYPDLVHPFVD